MIKTNMHTHRYLKHLHICFVCVCAYIHTDTDMERDIEVCNIYMLIKTVILFS